jgi:TPR repeat protein
LGASRCESVNDRNGFFLLAMCLLNRTGDCAADNAGAMALLWKAAHLGQAEAQEFLGESE